jgi:2-dehydropantoate 2-reductase
VFVSAVGKVAVIGSGSVGLYYGGKLAADGVDVHFLLRSGFDEASQRGISIFSVQGEDVHLKRPKIFRDVREIGRGDVVIVAVKSTSNNALEKLVPPLLHDETILLTLQNGLGNEELLAGRFGAERVLGGLCFVCLTRRTAASVDQFGHGTLSIGEYGGPPLARTRVLVEAFCESGIDARLVDDLGTERWRKLVWNIPFNGLAVAEGGLTVDKILDDRVLNARCRALMDETITAATALGHPIEKHYADLQIERTYPMGAYQPSTLVDWLAGRELEIEAMWGEPLRRAKRIGLSLPHLERLYERLKQLQTPSSQALEAFPLPQDADRASLA